MLPSFRKSISNCEENSVLIKTEDTHVSSTYYYYLNFMIVYANSLISGLSLKIPHRSLTYLTIPSNIIICKRFMLKGASKIIKEALKKSEISEGFREYATYTVTNQESKQDTSNVAHPTIIKESCDNEECSKKNCTKDESQCDIESKKAELVGHLSHSQKGVTEKDREIYQLESEEDSVAVIYHKSESSESAYHDYKYHESQMVQTDNNTKILNDATKNNE